MSLPMPATSTFQPRPACLDAHYLLLLYPGHHQTSNHGSLFQLLSKLTVKGLMGLRLQHKSSHTLDVKLHLQKQVEDCSWPVRCSLPTPALFRWQLPCFYSFHSSLLGKLLLK